MCIRDSYYKDPEKTAEVLKYGWFHTGDSGVMEDGFLRIADRKKEIFKTMRDLRDHDVEMLTIGQYLQASKSHLPVHRYVHPTEFSEYEAYAKNLGFKSAACGPLVRSSYHAEKQIFETAI